MITSILKVGFPALLSFLIAISLTPFLTHWMYKLKLWKKTPRTVDNPDEMSVAYQKIHNEQEETGTPRVGGVVIWSGVLAASVIIFLLSKVFGTEMLIELDFLSRSQTLIPFIAFVLGAGFGFLEDVLESYSYKFKSFRHGFSRGALVGVVTGIAIVFALWFYFKLDYRTITIPFAGPVGIGWLFIPYFIIVILGSFSSRVIDGIDGLSGGVLAIMFAAFGLIAIAQQQFDIAAFCFVIVGGLMAFLWFNIPPARFWMGETGMLALTLALPIVAFLLHRSLWILIIGFPLVATAFSSFAQICSKKYLGKKIFKVAPLHHHFQALGWSREKVVMRYWIFTVMVSVFGIVIALVV